ncbi:hypothetical protein HZ326_22812 [Fusarium oxysporum f. sp. albedinis]|nr:hypothetical protein HZ326_22812 [Fusarium oxysporum f. sp. albedinis]
MLPGVMNRIGHSSEKPCKSSTISRQFSLRLRRPNVACITASTPTKLILTAGHITKARHSVTDLYAR